MPTRGKWRFSCLRDTGNAGVPRGSCANPYLATSRNRLVLQLTSISLVQFKNYLRAAFAFDKRVVGICGPNGIGKTNLLDAIYYLCFTKSYFAANDSQNATTGLHGFRVEGDFQLLQEAFRIVSILRETGRKELTVNDDACIRVSSHIGRFPCVIIAPDDAAIITEGGESRRRFLNALLSQLSAEYLQALMDYNKVLQQRNGYLKSIAEKRSHDKNLLDIYDEQLTGYGSVVFQHRKNFLQDFIPEVGRIYNRIAQTQEEVGIQYQSQLLSTPFQHLLRDFREKDILLQRTLGGIHRDDLLITLNGQPFKTIASQGQRKSLLFALKLAEYESLKKSKGFAPILLLDDVFEKLDEQRMHNLLHWVCVKNEGQIFITDTHPHRITEHFGRLDVDFQMIEVRDTSG